MSYNKNTVIDSEINSIVKTLDDIGVKYKLTEITKYEGVGLNDMLDYEGCGLYSIRRLEYKNKVVLECVEKTCDCDCDDIIRSFKFNINDEPNDWKTESIICVCGECDKFNEICDQCGGEVGFGLECECDK